MFCSQAGPSFLFGITAGQLGDPRLAWVLWVVTVFSALSVAWLIPGEPDRPFEAPEPGSVTLVKSMNIAIRAMSGVCGWVVIFSVLLTYLKTWFLRLFPEEIQILFCGLLELTNGCLMLPGVEDLHLRFLLAVVMVNFGGICVWMQTATVAEGLRIKRYLYGKLLQTVFAVLYTLILLGNIWPIFPLVMVLTRRKLLKSRKSSSIPVEFGV